jgi:hypothetical protein
LAGTRALASITRLAAGTLLVALLAGGLPLAWVWVGSQVQGGTSPSATAIATVVSGLMMSYGIVALIAAWLKGRSAGPAPRTRYAWNRSMRDERYAPAATTFLENVLIVTTIVVAVGVTVWFFLYGNPGVPIT